MAALRPCPVSTTAPVCTNLTRFQSRYGSILPLNRRSTMLKIRAPLDRNSTLLKISHGIRAHGGDAGQPARPDPEELFVSGLTPEEKKIWGRVKEIAKGPPDRPFREEIDVIEDYMHKARYEFFYCESILHRKGAILTWKLCMSVHNAAILASKVVDRAALFRLGSHDEISLNTTKQIMRTYVSVFVKVAEDTHHKKHNRKTTVSLLGAIQGVASISHILVQDILANRTLSVSKDTSWDYEMDKAEVNRAHLEYQVEMNNFKDKLTTAHPELLEPTVHDALMCTEVYVRKMNMTRGRAISHMRGAAAREPADDK